MLVAIVDTRNDARALAATLSPLVRGVVEGLVGTAIIVTYRKDAEIGDIADHAGCRVIMADNWGEGFARAVIGANHAGFLVLDAGIQLPQGFWPDLADALPALGNRPAATMPSPRLGLLARLMQRMSVFRGQVSRESGLLLPPSRAREIALAKADPFAIRYGRALERIETPVTRLAAA